MVEPTLSAAAPVSPSISPAQALERLFTAPEIQPQWFTPTFLQQVSIAQITTILRNLSASLGSFRTIEPKQQGFWVVFEKGRVSTQIALNDRGEISGLLFQEIESAALSPDEAVQKFRELPGSVSLLIRQGDRELAALNADQPLAVGSAFKLTVLAALQQRIQNGKARWGDVVELKPEWKSLPSGFLHTWNDGALLTLQTLATLMISQSDNTATDALIHLVGREAIESLTARNRPFLTTREAFVLKDPQNAALLERWRQGNMEARRSLLAEIRQRPLPGTEIFAGDRPVATDVEWFYTARELCQGMQQVEALPLMSVNPGVANPANWARVAYKGGSEPGVLNLTTWLRASNNQTYCVVATWNHTEPLNETRFMTLYSSALEGLRK